MITTALAHPDSPIGNMKMLREMIVSPGAFEMVGRAFPGEISLEQRKIKGRALLENASAYIAAAKREHREAILQCSRLSLAEAVFELAGMDLTLDKELGHAFLIPYGIVCTARIGYKGLCQLFYRTGLVKAIQTAVVYQGEIDAKDRFDYQLGTNGFVNHRPLHNIERTWDTTYAAWMEATMVGGGNVIEVVDKAELVKIRAAAKKMAKGPAWMNWEMQMTRKAAVNRGASYLPKGTGTAMIAIKNALALEHREYDLDGHHERRKVEARVLSEETSTALKDDMEIEPPPTEGQAPPAGSKLELWEAVQAKRAGRDEALNNEKFMKRVVESLFGVGTEIKSKTQIKVLSDALLAKGLYDWETGEKIPLEIAGPEEESKEK